MIELLFVVLFIEGVVALLLLLQFEPLRELVIKSLDPVKMGKGRATVKTIAGTMTAILVSTFISIFKIQRKGVKLGTMSPMDQVLWRTHLLEASLMGFSLFLGFIIDRMHHYLSDLIRLRSTAGASKEEHDKLLKEKTLLKEKQEKSSQEIKLLQAKISTLSEELKKLKSECEEKDKNIETAESHVASLQKQAADLLLEYDRLLEENQNLQTQSHRF